MPQSFLDYLFSGTLPPSTPMPVGGTPQLPTSDAYDQPTYASLGIAGGTPQLAVPLLPNPFEGIGVSGAWQSIAPAAGAATTTPSSGQGAYAQAQAGQQARAAAQAQAQGSQAQGTTQGATPSQQAFFAEHLPYAQQALNAAGMNPGLAPALVGIAANETGYGNPQYTYGNNYFGVKATGSEPQTGQLGTWEVVNGSPVTTTSSFRTYQTPAESYTGMLQFLRDNPRYAGALQAQQNPAAFMQGLQAAGYATDPAWASKVLNIAGQAQSGVGVPTVGTLPLIVRPDQPVPADSALRRLFPQMTNPVGPATSDADLLPILIGPNQPLPANSPFRQMVPNLPNPVGAAPNSLVPLGSGAAGATAQHILAEAQNWIGSPYVLGGQTPAGTDCSGFIVGAAAAAGAPFPPGVRTAEQIRQVSTPVAPGQVQPGDLVFFQGTDGSTPAGQASHVGIVTEQGVMLNASQPGTPLGPSALSTPWAQQHLLSYARPPQYSQIPYSSGAP